MAPVSTIASSTSDAARHRRVGLGARVEARGRLGQAGQHRRLPERQPPRRDAEIQPRRGIHAIGAGAEIDAVQVDLQRSRPC